MTSAFFAWFALGLVTGELHMGALWSHVRRRPAIAWVRVPLSVGVLVAAALLHGLAGAAIGWAVGAVFGVTLRLARVGRAS